MGDILCLATLLQMDLLFISITSSHQMVNDVIKSAGVIYPNGRLTL